MLLSLAIRHVTCHLTRTSCIGTLENMEGQVRCRIIIGLICLESMLSSQSLLALCHER